MNVHNIIEKICLGTYTILWIGGIVSYVFLTTLPKETTWAASAFLFFAAINVFIKSDNIKNSLTLLIIGLLGFGAEILGVYTGFPFGSYYYSDTLIPKLFGVPFALTAAWLILIAYSWQVVLWIKLPRFLAVIISAVIMVIIDLIIDPLAAGPLNFWKWKCQGIYYGIPLTNFLGWLFVSIILLSLYSQVRHTNKAHRLLGLSVILFFSIIAVSYLYIIPALIGFLIFIAHITFEIRFKHSKNFSV
jgi:putative membrane protein